MARLHPAIHRQIRPIAMSTHHEMLLRSLINLTLHLYEAEADFADLRDQTKSHFAAELCDMTARIRDEVEETLDLELAQCEIALRR
jgi:hypothetical protein